MGKRGKDRLDINGGNSFRRSRISGLGRSGDVHIRMYPSSVSSKASSALEVKGVRSSFTGLNGSCLFDASSVAEVFPSDGERVWTGCGGTGESKNGSLGTRARFGLTVDPATAKGLSSDGNGWERERACIEGGSGKVP